MSFHVVCVGSVAVFIHGFYMKGDINNITNTHAFAYIPSDKWTIWSMVNNKVCQVLCAHVFALVKWKANTLGDILNLLVELHCLNNNCIRKMYILLYWTNHFGRTKFGFNLLPWIIQWVWSTELFVFSLHISWGSSSNFMRMIEYMVSYVKNYF